MNILIENLIKTLKAMVSYHKNLYALLKKEKEIMIKYSIQEFEKCTKEKETITLKLKIIEESRIKIIKKLSTQLQKNPDELTISALADMVDGAHRSVLNQQCNTLKKLIAEISRLNDENRIYIECFMNHIKLSVSFLKQVKFDEITYLNTGEATESKVNSRVLCEI